MSDARPSPASVWALVAFGLLLWLGVLAEVPWLNGPWYWRWPWRQLPVARALLCFAPALALYALLLWRWNRGLAAPGSTVAGLVACALLLQLAGSLADPRGPALVEEIVRSLDATSYYTDAEQIDDVRAWLAGFDRARLSFHGATHPPGPVLYFRFWLVLAGPESAPRWAAWALALLSSAGVALVHRFAGLFTARDAARLGPCFVYALVPAPVLFFPELDQLYPLLALGLWLAWDRALRRPLQAVALGLVLFVTSLMAYNLLILALPLALYGGWRVRQAPDRGKALRAALGASALALATAAAAHALLYALCSFDALGSLRHALAVQDAIAPLLGRPYWACLFFDVYDFALGGGMLALPLALMFLWSTRARPEDRTARALTAIGLLTVAAVDSSGLLRCETARVWLFLQPLVAVPAGLLLARLRGRERSALLTLQALLLLALKVKMTFVEP